MLLVGIGFVCAQEGSPVKFKITKFDFGTIKEGKPATASFSFVNTTNKPVIIEFATASCGCTKPDYPKQPVMPGKSAVVKATYNAEAKGHFNKSVTLKFVGVKQPVILNITGTVK